MMGREIHRQSDENRRGAQHASEETLPHSPRSIADPARAALHVDAFVAASVRRRMESHCKCKLAAGAGSAAIVHAMGTAVHSECGANASAVEVKSMCAPNPFDVNAANSGKVDIFCASTD
jgi:hypothetical protein